MIRKLIGLITCYPEAEYQQRVLEGVFAQCRAYGYDVAVFAPLMQASTTFKNYMAGEMRVFDIINFDRLDGLIITTISIQENNTSIIYDSLVKMLRERCRIPVVSLDYPLEDYPEVTTDDTYAFLQITSHLIDVHGCKKIFFLTGMKDHLVSERRLEGYKRSLAVRGMEFCESNVFYGDFWYDSGEDLARRIASGDLSKPDAVICASDHMAIGLINELERHGISVPDDIIVTGYDATVEAAMNDISVTTYIPDLGESTAKAVNLLRSKIEPDAPLIEPKRSRNNGIRLCASCGCGNDSGYVKDKMRSVTFGVNRNYNDPGIFDSVDIGRLLDSYMLEDLTGSLSPQDCLERIFKLDYLLRPYSHFYLCLNDNWLIAAHNEGLSDTMKLVIHTIPGKDMPGEFCSDTDAPEFPLSQMLPALDEEHDEPYVYYFTCVHFLEITLGYAVLQCSLEQERKINLVYRNWIRNVNSALEMARVENQLTLFSERDAMTGLYNRRGMEYRLDELMKRTETGDNVMVCVIDMDGLKAINDNFGHNEGDLGIVTIANNARAVTGVGEFCVRAGGDEFYIIGKGAYNDEHMTERIAQFESRMAEYNACSGKDYKLSASVGYAIGTVGEGFDIKTLIQTADKNMYLQKYRRKAQRK